MLMESNTSILMAESDVEVSDAEDDQVSQSSTYRKSLVRKGRSTGTSGYQMKSARDANMDKWLADTEEDRHRTGALTLTNLGVLLLCFELVRLWNRPKCAQNNWLVHGPELAVLSLLILKTSYCIYEPKKWLYWFGIGFYFFYIPAVMLPPFQMSCTELFEKCSASAAEDWYIRETLFHVNCSLQGQTSQQVLMTLFLLLPWLLPKLKMMYFTLVWVLGVYLFWTMAYQELIDQGFYSTTDVMIRLLLLSGSFVLSYFKKKQIQKNQMDQWISDQMQLTAKRRLMGVFIEMLPPHVIPRVYNTGRCSDTYQLVSIMFVLIDDFDEKFVSRMETRDLLDFLNGVFSQLDRICEDRGVTKIETVGEEFVCCVGVTPEHVNESQASGGHEQILGYLFEAAGDMLEQQTDNMKFKMGIHSGPVIAGVVGQKLPRYRLFGDTINTAARMMQKGMVGQVQFGVETKDHMPDWVKRYTEDRGLVEMKGKGKVQTYLFSNKEGGSSAPPTGSIFGGSMALPHPSSPVAEKKRVSFQPFAEHSEQRMPPRTLLHTGLLKKLLKGTRNRLTRHSWTTAFSESSELAFQESQTSIGDFGPTSSRGFEYMETIEAEMLAVEAQIQRQESFNLPNSWFARVASRLFPHVLSEKIGFTPEMEEALIQQHHESFMKKMVPNIDKIFLAALVMTLCEAMFMVYSKCWRHEHDYFPGHARLTIFIACRLVVLGILGYFRHAAAKATWAFSAPSRFQQSVVFGLCACVILYFLSYDVLTTGQHRRNTRTTWKAPIDQVFSLIFMLLFFVVIRWKFRFYQSLYFIGLAAVIWGLILIRDLNGVYFPYLGQVLFFGLAIANSVLAHQEEQSIRARYKAQRSTRQMKKTIHQILETMMPPLVLKGLRSNAIVATVHDYKAATIAQSDLCGFTKLASTRTASEVVGLIGEIFGRFDVLTDNWGIYKVETVGDAYIAGMAEKPLTLHNSPFSVVEFGKAMVRVVNEWSQEQNVSVRCRVGVHHGRCVGGIVGMNQQRYHLFGKLLVGLEVLESTAPEGGVQLSRECKDAVDRELKALKKEDSGWCVERDGAVLVTSKGEEHKFEEVGGRTFVIVAS